MTELNSFDNRLERAVHAYADRAATDVDAVAVATRAIGRRPTGIRGVLSRTVAIPVPLVVLAALVIAVGAWTVAGGPWPFGAPAGPASTPVATPSPATSPTPSVAPDAPAFVSGTASFAERTPGASTVDRDGVTHIAGLAITVLTNADDPRVTGTGTYRLDVAVTGPLGFVSGTLRLEVAGGGWTGSCSGATWNDLESGSLSCWLAGSGSNTGLSLYLNHRFTASTGPGAILGTILPGEPPSP